VVDNAGLEIDGKIAGLEKRQDRSKSSRAATAFRPVLSSCQSHYLFSRPSFISPVFFNGAFPASPPVKSVFCFAGEECACMTAVTDACGVQVGVAGGRAATSASSGGGADAPGAGAERSQSETDSREL